MSGRPTMERTKFGERRMTKLIKDGKPILDGTRPLYKVEEEIFHKLGEVEKLMEKYHIPDTKTLEKVVTQYCLLAIALFQLKENLNGKDKT